MLVLISLLKLFMISLPVDGMSVSVLDIWRGFLIQQFCLGTGQVCALVHVRVVPGKSMGFYHCHLVSPYHPCCLFQNN